MRGRGRRWRFCLFGILPPPPPLSRRGPNDDVHLLPPSVPPARGGGAHHGEATDNWKERRNRENADASKKEKAEAGNRIELGRPAAGPLCCRVADGNGRHSIFSPRDWLAALTTSTAGPFPPPSSTVAKE